MNQSVYSGRATLALSRIQRILSKHNIPFRLTDAWTLDQLSAYCDQIDDVELVRQIAVLQVELGETPNIAA